MAFPNLSPDHIQCQTIALESILICSNTQETAKLATFTRIQVYQHLIGEHADITHVAKQYGIVFWIV